jgi:hypothetical protein
LSESDIDGGFGAGINEGQGFADGLMRASTAMREASSSARFALSPDVMRIAIFARRMGRA